MANLTAYEVEETIKQLLPNEGDRKICLSFFLEALKKANSYGSNKWGAYCYKDRVRLLVGNLIVCTIHKNRIWVALDKQMLSDRMDIKKSLEASELWSWEKEDYSEYIPVPSMNGYYTPCSGDLEILPIIKNLHFTYIEKVAKRYIWLNYRSQPKHSKELIKHLKKEFGQNVPSPNYMTDSDADILQDIAEFEANNKELTETERQALIQSRVGQGVFRKDLIKYWKKCAITGCELIATLKASHIKPWSHSNNMERLDVYNGLLLTPNLDIAFDKGYISFDDEGKIIISVSLREDDKNTLGINSEMKIRRLKQDHIKYLEYHRENIFERFKHK